MSELGDADDPTGIEVGVALTTSDVSVDEQSDAEPASKRDTEVLEDEEQADEEEDGEQEDEEEEGEEEEDEEEDEQKDEEEEKEEEEEEDEEEDEDEEEEEETMKEEKREVGLTPKMFAEGLSLLCKTGDGLAHAFVRLDATNRGLTSIDMLRSFVHLRYVDVSRNELDDVSALGWLDHLLTVRVDFNQLAGSVVMLERRYLQLASFADNRLTTCDGAAHPMLDHLCLNNNQITTVDELDTSQLTCLHTLELRGNRISTLAGLNIPSLKNLFLANNEISSVEGLDALVNLTILHLRANNIGSLNKLSPRLVNLQYLNCRENKITETKSIKTLRQFTSLKKLVLTDNPVSEVDDYRMEVLIRVPQLDTLDKEEFVAEDKQEALAAYEERKEEFDLEDVITEQEEEEEDEAAREEEEVVKEKRAEPEDKRDEEPQDHEEDEQLPVMDSFARSSASHIRSEIDLSIPAPQETLAPYL